MEYFLNSSSPFSQKCLSFKPISRKFTGRPSRLFKIECLIYKAWHTIIYYRQSGRTNSELTFKYVCHERPRSQPEKGRFFLTYKFTIGYCTNRPQSCVLLQKPPIKSRATKIHNITTNISFEFRAETDKIL
jgi:hypothetical protein